MSGEMGTASFGLYQEASSELKSTIYTSDYCRHWKWLLDVPSMTRISETCWVKLNTCPSLRLYQRPEGGAASRIYMHLYAASAALKVAFRSYCPLVINEYFMSSPLSRKICGRGGNKSAVPMAIVMWSSSIVPHVEGDFRPNHFVVLQKMVTRPEYVDLTANSSTTSAHEDFTLASHNDSKKVLSGHLKDVAAAAAADDDDMSNIRDLDEVPTSPLFVCLVS